MPREEVNNILVCDDDPLTRALHSHYLRKAGYRVLTASSAEDAFEVLCLEDPDAPPQADLILMDLMMPRIDGLEACRRIQKAPTYKGVPVMMVTAAEPEDKQLSAYDSGAVDFITKPVDENLLLARIAALLNLRREAGRPAGV